VPLDNVPLAISPKCGEVHCSEVLYIDSVESALGSKGDSAVKMSGLKGHYDALTQVGNNKKCFPASTT